MNYRIHFNYTTAKFEVQILAYFIFWCMAKGMTFDTLDEAVAKINTIGLDRLYVDKSADIFQREVVAAA